ncbi:MAG: family 16 glycosylhydrolase [Marinilabiliaceae bacterium]|nr:family 16 glycosylhydrolase [Marinilabiliaceae bacterium]
MANIFSFLFRKKGIFTPTKKFEAKRKKEKEIYLKFIKDSSSDIILRFQKLEQLINSNDYKLRVTELKNNKQYKKSAEKENFDEYSKLLKNKRVKWYYKTLREKNFKEQQEWEVTFEDDFTTIELDKSKWITGYYWGNVLMHDKYVTSAEKQFFSDANIIVKNGTLRLITKQDSVRGKSWDPLSGIREKDFEYTSGLISTGQSFRQQYGKFEAKIRFTEAFPLINAFWLPSEKMFPQIDILKTAIPKGKEVSCGVHGKSSNNKIENLLSTIKGDTFIGRYFVYSLEWSPQALIWKINGTEVHRETRIVPNEPMYISFCTILTENPNPNQLPAYMEIDWVKCYQKKEF